VNIILASIDAAQASYQSRLPFPEPVASNAVAKSGTFRDDPGRAGTNLRRRSTRRIAEFGQSGSIEALGQAITDLA